MNQNNSSNQKNIFKGASADKFAKAHDLREHLTRVEAILWEQLRNRKLRGLKFSRQHPIDKFIADFYCFEHKVVIELDGGIHLEKEMQQYDAARTVQLEQLGIRVLRFKNEEIERNLEMVLKKIIEFILG